jgi:fucose 4-O-acetylase-like acetyltransferase
MPLASSTWMDSSEDSKAALSEDIFFIRGASILLVVLVHVIGVEPLHGVRKLSPEDLPALRLTAGVIHSFNMQVMLIGSGAAAALFGRSDTSFLEFTRKKLRKLVLPLLIWAPLFLGVQELTRARSFALSEGLALLRQLPTAWFPPYAIFWFIHALVGCTLLAWAYRRLPIRLGRWEGPLYLALAVLLRTVTEAWQAPTDNLLVDYLGFILRWNCFFGLGLCLAPWLGPTRRWLHRRPWGLQALLPVGLFGLLVCAYLACPSGHDEALRQINGPLGFCMLFTLASFLEELARRRGGGWQALRSRGVFLGSISMAIYLFHIYFLSGLRLALEGALPGAPLALHLGLGWLAGLLGPVGLYLGLRTHRAFQWSLGRP